MSDSVCAAFYVGTGTVVDRAIRFARRSPYSHVEALLERIDTHTWLCGSSSPRDGGVRLKRITLNPDNWQLLPDPHADAVSMRAWFEEHTGQKYDWLGALGFALPVPLDSARRWYCSEAYAAARGSVDAWRYDPALIANALQRCADCRANVPTPL